MRHTRAMHQRRAAQRWPTTALVATACQEPLRIRLRLLHKVASSGRRIGAMKGTAMLVRAGAAAVARRHCARATSVPSFQAHRRPADRAHTHAELPVALEAAAAHLADTRVEVEALDGAAAQHGASAATSVRVVRSELPEHQRLLWPVRAEQRMQAADKDVGVVIEEDDPLRAAARIRRGVLRQRECREVAVLCPQRALAVC